MGYQEKYKEWLENEYFDDEFIGEIKSIKDDENEKMERFYTDLAFGTAGLRGIIGAGTNRINKYIVRKTTQGFANYLQSTYQGDLSVVIAYDPRRKSEEFTIESAKVLAANGIKTYVFDDVRTTPELSFAVRYLNCTGGIMITASHNPPEYNGYKVYDNDGCQLVPHLADKLTATVNKVQGFDEVKVMEEKEAIEKGMIVYINEEVDKPYFDMINKVSVNPDLFKKASQKVVYTPLHGTGGMSIVRTMKEFGFDNLVIVDSQMKPDGEFPTTPNPNPEAESAFAEALKTAKDVDADLIIGTDPDCDRMGMMIKSKDGYLHLTGNQIGVLFMEYILSAKEDLNGDNFVVNTIVSTDLGVKIAEKYGVKLIKTLTGFKFIGEQIKNSPDNFIMGYEESYGYLFDKNVRDKDAVMGTLMAIEMNEYFSQKGSSLIEKLEDIYSEFGYYYEETIAKTYKGKEGLEKIQDLMDLFRKEGKSLLKADGFIDYQNDETGLPKSNVLKFLFEDDSWIVLRPSGTEPKIKLYFSIIGKDKEDAISKFKSASQRALANF